VYIRENIPETEILQKGTSGFWYSNMVRNFRILSPEMLIQGGEGAKWGYAFSSFSINAPKYLQYLQAKIVNLGGIAIRSSLPSGVGLSAVLDAVTLIVENQFPQKLAFAFVLATGMGTKQLIGDNAMFPMKSQSVYVKGEAHNIVDRLAVGHVAGDGHDKSEDTPGIPIHYGSPRPGSGYTVLGGFMEEHNWYAELHLPSSDGPKACFDTKRFI
jgi:D-amino-acid oxidase